REQQVTCGSLATVERAQAQDRVAVLGLRRPDRDRVAQAALFAAHGELRRKAEPRLGPAALRGRPRRRPEKRTGPAGELCEPARSSIDGRGVRLGDTAGLANGDPLLGLTPPRVELLDGRVHAPPPPLPLSGGFEGRSATSTPHRQFCRSALPKAA